MYRRPREIELKKEQTIEAIRAAVESLHEKIDLDEEGCYEEPQVTADNEKLQATLQKMPRVCGSYNYLHLRRAEGSTGRSNGQFLAACGWVLK